MKHIANFAKFWLPAISYMLLIIILSSVSSPPVPQLDWDNIDKLYHAIEYCVLSFLVLWAFINSPWKRLSNHAMLFACLWATLFGATDEIHQAFVSNRSASVVDWIFDTIGAIFGAFALYLLLKLSFRVRKYNKNMDS
jgi:VanZ family protein